MVRHLRPATRPAYAALALAAFAAPTAAWADDYPSDPSTQGVATTGELITGAIDTPGDTDWFTLTLTAGLRYTIDMEGSETGRGTLPDPYLRVHADDGFLLDQNDDGGEGFNSRMILRPDADETVYVSAGAYADAVGTYTLTISAVEAPPDDFPESVDTPGLAEVGGRCHRRDRRSRRRRLVCRYLGGGTELPHRYRRLAHRPRLPARPVPVPVRCLGSAIADQ